MRIKKQNIKNLIPYAKNARTHSDLQVAQIAGSIKEFGFCNPVLVDSDNGIIAGHGRVLAAELLNMEEVPTICLAHLSETQKQAYIIADNKMALNAGWDEELLSLELEQLQESDFDMELTGFDEAELSELLGGVNFEPGTEEEQGKLDELEPKMVTCPHCNKEFDTREQE